MNDTIRTTTLPRRARLAGAGSSQPHAGQRLLDRRQLAVRELGDVIRASPDDGRVGAAGLEGTIAISGSSTVQPITSAIAEAFNEPNPDVAISVDGPGTGDGFKTFCAGETDISDASRKIKDEEAAVCKAAGIEYIELKIAIDGMSVLTSTANTAVSCLSFADLYALTGEESQGFKTWADAQALAKELGSNTTFPSGSLDIFGPGEESGTYDSFIELALKTIATGRGKTGTATRPDYTSSANDNAIIDGIANSATSLGWVGFAYAEENKDKVERARGLQGSQRHLRRPDRRDHRRGEYPALARPLHLRQQGQGRGEPGRWRRSSTTTWPTARSRPRSRPCPTSTCRPTSWPRPSRPGPAATDGRLGHALLLRGRTPIRGPASPSCSREAETDTMTASSGAMPVAPAAAPDRVADAPPQ